MSPVRVPLIVAACLLASPALAQQTPGQINDPSTYRGSMANQAAEQAAASQQAAANQAMQQRLDQNYAAYTPRGGGGGGGGGAPQAKPLKSYPLLPAARNPLLGRWQQQAAKPLNLSNIPLLFPGTEDIVNGAFAGGCKSVFGSAGVTFAATTFSFLATDGHEEVLNHVEYRADGANIIVLASDGDLPLIFGMPDKDHAVVAFFGCQMSRLAPGVKPVSLNARPPGAAAAPAAAAIAPGSAILKLTVGSVINGTFSSPPAGTRFFITSQNPDTSLVRAGFAPPPGGQPIDGLFNACKLNQGGTQERCNQGMQALTSGSLGAAALDSDGHAETGALAPGRYYVVGFTPYQGHSLIWHLPVDLKPGANAVSLTPQNGSISH
jgi:hypothetical protein